MRWTSAAEWLSRSWLTLLLGLVLSASSGLAFPYIGAEQLTFQPMPELGSTVHGIVQDGVGFLWFGTQRGLYRYDGHTFKGHFQRPGDPTSLSSDEASILYVDRSGTLWVGSGFTSSGAGLNRYEPSTETFTRFRYDPQDPTSLSHDDILSIFEDHTGTLWVGTLQGLNRYDRTTGRFTRYRHDPNGPGTLNHDTIQAITEDREGVLWIGTGHYSGGGGLCSFQRETEKFTCFTHVSSAPTSPGLGMISDVLEDHAGRLWSATEGNGLCRLERSTGSFVCYLHGPDSPADLSEYGIVKLYEDDSGLLWLGTWGGGLIQFDPETQHLDRYRYNPKDARSLSADRIRAIYQDHSGILWIGTWSGGVNKLSRAARRIKSYVLPNNTVVWDVLEDRAGNLWAGTSQGLYHIKGPGRGEWTQVLPGDVYVLHESRSGALWVGTRGQGFYMFDPKTGAKTLYRHDPNDPASLADDSINIVYEDRAGTLWVGGTGALLQRLNDDRKSFTRYRIGKAFSLETLLEDRQGNLWVGTIAEGICRFDRETGTSTCYGHEQDNPASLSENNVVTLHEDGQGLLWLGTANKGLVQFDVRANTFRSFDVRNSCLRADRINAILEDARGILWLSTNKGVIRFDPRKESCVSYGVYDGLLSLQGTNESSLQSSQGEFFFGSYGGLHVFFPEDLEALRASPKVVLTEVRLFNQTLQPGPGSPLRQTSIWAEELVLAHDQNSLTFDFAALDFTHPELHQYKYRLEGFDSEWIEAGTRHSATYTNLDSGNYVFRVRGASEGGMWQEGSTALRVVILPPWWRTRWAYGSYGLLLVAALFVAESLQRQRLIRRERARAEREQARLKAEATERELQQARAIEQAYAELKRTQARLLQQEKLASLGRLSAGIAHEIRNPLNFIHNFAQLSTELSAELRRELEAERGRLDPKRHADLEEMLTTLEANTRKIEEHGQRADGIVRSMLNHSRATSGERQATDLNMLLEEYLSLISHNLRGQHPQDDVKIERDYDPQVGEIELAPQEMGRVFLGLLDNAFYFAREQKTRPDRAAQQPLVRVETRRQDKQIEIRVADNGPGIQEALKEKIFEPFFTTKPAGQGTGLGLSLSYDIVVQGHGGTLSVESEEGRGAVFVIRLPRE